AGFFETWHFSLGESRLSLTRPHLQKLTFGTNFVASNFFGVYYRHPRAVPCPLGASFPPASSAIRPDQFTTFGDLLRFLRRRAGLTQRELAGAVSYSHGPISRLEQNHRPPDPTTVAARFVPALGLDR